MSSDSHQIQDTLSNFTEKSDNDSVQQTNSIVENKVKEGEGICVDEAEMKKAKRR